MPPLCLTTPGSFLSLDMLALMPCMPFQATACRIDNHPDRLAVTSQAAEPVIILASVHACPHRLCACATTSGLPYLYPPSREKYFRLFVWPSQSSCRPLCMLALFVCQSVEPQPVVFAHSRGECAVVLLCGSARQISGHLIFWSSLSASLCFAVVHNSGGSAHSTQRIRGDAECVGRH